MNLKNLQTLILGLTLPLTWAHATSDATRKMQTKVFETSPHTCSLKRFTLGQITFDSKSSESAGRIEMISALVETTDPTCIKDYAFVQWIRGCVYSRSYKKSDKSLVSHFGYSRQNRGQSTPFVHADWEVDSMKVDPLYYGAPANSVTDPKRLDYYRIPKAKIDFTKQEKALPELEKLVNFRASYDIAQDLTKPYAIHSVKDSPTQASWYPNPYDTNLESSTVASLEFHMCVYRTKDVPLEGDPARFDKPESEGGPIHCLDWNAKNKWNHETQKMETFTDMDAKCSEPVPTH